MKIRGSIAAAGAAVVLGVTAAFLVPAAASAHDATHTLVFTATAVNLVMFTPTTRAVQDTDTNSAGQTIGFDNLYLTFTSAASASGNATLDISGGFLYATIAVTNGGQTLSGKVTGGTGAFSGATGTVIATATNAAGTAAAVTVTYSTQNSQG
jgi:hypothetical protein